MFLYEEQLLCQLLLPLQGGFITFSRGARQDFFIAPRKVPVYGLFNSPASRSFNINEYISIILILQVQFMICSYFLKNILRIRIS